MFLAANYTLNTLAFTYWRKIILTFYFSFTGRWTAQDRQQPPIPSSKVCPMSFHLEWHFCLISTWNFTWNIFIHIFLINDSIQLFANSETNETLTTVRQFSSSFVACPVIIQKNAFQSADSERFCLFHLLEHSWRAENNINNDSSVLLSQLRFGLSQCVCENY